MIVENNLHLRGQFNSNNNNNSTNTKHMPVISRSASSCSSSVSSATTTTAMTTSTSTYKDYGYMNQSTAPVKPLKEDFHPMQQMFRIWVYGIILPAALLAWTSTKNISAVLLSMMAIPALSILQGARGILHFRHTFGDAPVPLAPSHGVVMVAPNDASKVDDRDCKPSEKPPLRLLVIGDSLAIGVGQTKSPTPVMPEVIAKSLSKAMGGRPVFWTCHGQPGASAGWIVRELEHGIKSSTLTYNSKPVDNSLDDNFLDDDEDENDNDMRSLSSRESSSTSSSSSLSSDDEDDEIQLWRRRLRQHRRRFDPNGIGPYDIAVVLTGSNDLKSAFFPFLLAGEDAEFHKQAQNRGGDYSKELRRVLDVLSRRLRLRLQLLRESVEAATEKAREAVENAREAVNSARDNVMDRLHIPPHLREQASAATRANCDSKLLTRRQTNTLVTTSSSSSSNNSANGTEGSKSFPSELPSASSFMSDNSDEQDHIANNTNENMDDIDDTCELEDEIKSRFPKVVLPGLPARALPAFQLYPLKWLAVPVVDAMESHKRNIAKLSDGEVMYVEAVTSDDLDAYQEHTGPYWQQKCEEQVVLSVRDIQPKDARRILHNMNQYFGAKGQETLHTEDRLRTRESAMFCLDQVHPCDAGYDFWGRYISNAIIAEWQKKSNLAATSSSSSSPSDASQ